MGDLIININQIKDFSIYCIAFFVNIWFFIKLNALRKMSKRFLANSERENFEGGLKLVRNVRCLFAFIILLDVSIFFFHSYNLSHYLKTNVIYVFIVLLVIFYVHLRLGIPVVLNGGKAETRFRNLYPPVPKAEADKQADFNSQQFNEEESLYEAVQTQMQKPTAALNKAGKETQSENTDEIIEYDDEGYIGAWQPQKSNADKAEEKEREEEVKTKECPFCGTLNGINNVVCDFCGADIPEQKE